MSSLISDASVEEAVALLNSNSNYKVLSRLAPRRSFSKHNGKRLERGVVVDTETTGTEFEKDAIIELGMVLFEYDPDTGEAFNVLGSIDQLEDPGFPIPPESTAVHGISDDLVSGKSINDAEVKKFLEGVSIVIAHNAKFDRTFLEKRLPIFESLPWGCSYEQVDWRGQGIGSAKLDYLAYQYGFFYEAHRAEVDCFALLEVLQNKLPKSDELVLKAILNGLREKSYTISALGAPFETKDTLKSKHYRWNPERKYWYMTVTSESALKDEIAWLKCNVYGDRPAKVEIEVRNCLNRYSLRPGKREIKEI